MCRPCGFGGLAKGLFRVTVPAHDRVRWPLQQPRLSLVVTDNAFGVGGCGPLMHLVMIVRIQILGKHADEAGGMSCVASNFASYVIRFILCAHGLLHWMSKQPCRSLD